MTIQKGFIARHGRKFVLSLFAMMLGTIVTVFGIAACVKEPTASPSIAGIVTAFAGILAVGIGAFSASNAYVTGKAMKTGTDPIPTEHE